MAEVNKLSKSLGATWKFKAPEGWHKTGYIPEQATNAQRGSRYVPLLFI